MGFFSWTCCKSGESIWNTYSSKGATPCVLVTPDGNFIEKNYEGYGEFGGLDVFAWLAYANGFTPEVSSLEELVKDKKLQEEVRSRGIKLYFSKEKPKDYKPIKIVSLKYYDNEKYWELGSSYDCLYQGYFIIEDDIEQDF